MPINAEWTPVGDPSCCCFDCCLYPWPDPNGGAGGPYYSFNDLPDLINITLAGVLYPDSPKTDFGGIGLWGYTNPAYLTGSEPLLSAGDNGAWAYGDDQGAGSQPCLIGDVNAGTFSEDQFLDQYILTGNYDIGSGVEPINIALDRNTTCTWTQDLDGFIFQLRYNKDTYKWEIVVVNDYRFGKSEKPDPQNDPVDSYPDSTTGVMTDLVISP